MDSPISFSKLGEKIWKQRSMSFIVDLLDKSSRRFQSELNQVYLD